jgi:transcriptional regulator
MHGWGITSLIKAYSNDVLLVNEGSLYPSLYRLKRQRLVSSEWRQTENNRRARYYLLTDRGRQRLAEERAEWERLSGAVNRVLQTAEKSA